jgi:hypothetical protein
MMQLSRYRRLFAASRLGGMYVCMYVCVCMYACINAAVEIKKSFARQVDKKLRVCLFITVRAFQACVYMHIICIYVYIYVCLSITLQASGICTHTYISYKHTYTHIHLI